jgi:hypothetical protein
VGIVKLKPCLAELADDEPVHQLSRRSPEIISHAREGFHARSCPTGWPTSLLGLVAPSAITVPPWRFVKGANVRFKLASLWLLIGFWVSGAVLLEVNGLHHRYDRVAA